MRLLPLLLLALPLLEIAGFVVVGSRIGALATVGLVIAAAVLGLGLIRRAGAGAPDRLRRAADLGDPAPEIADTALTFTAGILLVAPGFVTDLMGLALLLPPVRALLRRRFGDRVIVSSTAGFPGRGFGAGRNGRVVDLDPEDWQAQERGGDGKDSPWRGRGGGDLPGT